MATARGSLWALNYRIRMALGLENCRRCGRAPVDGHSETWMTWEHIVPASQRGGFSMGNLTITCSSCNQARGTKTPDWKVRSLRVEEASVPENKRISLSHEYGETLTEIKAHLRRVTREREGEFVAARTMSKPKRIAGGGKAERKWAAVAEGLERSRQQQAEKDARKHRERIARRQEGAALAPGMAESGISLATLEAATMVKRPWR